MSFYFSAGPSSPSTNPSPNASGAPSRRRLSRSSPYSVPVRGVGVATEESEDGTVGSFVPLNSSLNANSVESDDEMAESASVAGSVSDSVITQSSRASEPAAEERRMEQRQKQIDYGKNTIGYERYTSVIRKYVYRGFEPLVLHKELCLFCESYFLSLNELRAALAQTQM